MSVTMNDVGDSILVSSTYKLQQPIPNYFFFFAKTNYIVELQVHIIATAWIFYRETYH